MPFEVDLDVTIVEALPNILAGWNPELAGEARKILESKGVQVLDQFYSVEGQLQ